MCGMPHNVLACDREQSFLLPPDVRDWLPEEHLAWFVIDAVGVMDLAAFWRRSMPLIARTVMGARPMSRR
jgi:hypothetical protein